MGDFLKENFANSSRKVIVATFLTSGSLAWFFLLQTYFQDILIDINMPEFMWVEIGKILYYGFAVLAAIFGSYMAPKIQRKKLIFIWISSGICRSCPTPFLLL